MKTNTPHQPHTLSSLCMGLVVALLGGCATAPNATPSQPPAQAHMAEVNPETAPATTTTTPNNSDLGKAIASPLTDLNVVRADIPAVLMAARKAPYERPADLTCPALAAQVQALDAVLGPDLDTPPTAGNPGLIERGAGAVAKGAVGAVQGAAQGLIPMRGWVRKLTGAERYAKEVEASITAGTIRRGYLKGWAQSTGCDAPAAPRTAATQ